MTIEERFERIELVTACIGEQWRREREEIRQLWRDTQRQIESTQRQLDLFITESRASDERLKQRMEQLAEEFRAEDAKLRESDRRLQERIDSLVSDMGKFIASQQSSGPSAPVQ
jgi:chromosome segregation ATPase